MNRHFFPNLLVLTLFTVLSSCAANPTSSPADGSWNFTMSSPFGALNAMVIMSADSGTLIGSFDLGDGRIWPIEDGVADGDEISFRLDRDNSPVVYDMSATVEGDSVNGSASAMGTEVPWTMTRRS